MRWRQKYFTFLSTVKKKKKKITLVTLTKRRGGNFWSSGRGCLPMQGTRSQSLVWEYSTRLPETKPVHRQSSLCAAVKTQHSQNYLINYVFFLIKIKKGEMGLGWTGFQPLLQGQCFFMACTMPAPLFKRQKSQISVWTFSIPKTSTSHFLKFWEPSKHFCAPI